MTIDLENKYFGNIQKTLTTILNYLHKLNSFLKLNLSQHFLLFSIFIKTKLKKNLTFMLRCFKYHDCIGGLLGTVMINIITDLELSTFV